MLKERSCSQSLFLPLVKTAFNTEVSARGIEGVLTAFAPLGACDHVEYYTSRERPHEIDVLV